MAMARRVEKGRGREEGGDGNGGRGRGEKEIEFDVAFYALVLGGSRYFRVNPCLDWFCGL